MRKVYTPTTRKVYAQATPSPQNTTTVVRRLVHNNSLQQISSPDNAPRILKNTTISRASSSGITISPSSHTVSSHQQNNSSVISLQAQQQQQMKCYVCDGLVGGQGARLLDTYTATTHTKLPNKIGRVIGDAFLVVVRADDIVCRRCVNLFNQFDQVESQLDLIKTQLMGYICKKYSIEGEDVKGPAAKLQKLNSGLAADSSTGASAVSTAGGNTIVRLSAGSGSVSHSPSAAIVASTPSPVTRKVPMKVYKCMSCEFTTSDLKMFTPHYAVCPGVQAAAAAENNTTTSSTVTIQQQQQQQQPGSQNSSTSSTLTATSQTSITQTNHSSNATSPQATISASGKILARRPITQNQTSQSTSQTKLITLKGATPGAAETTFSCNLCPFKGRDKATYDEHMRRHIKVKPFKCRICNARFETRETASKHARAHQTEYYKCGTCSVAYRERDQLIKHFEVHRNDGTVGNPIIIKGSTATAAQKAAAAAVASAAATAAKPASTQKLLQETIDEALSEAAPEVDAKNIHFFSCSICSLTFIQENYFNQHMETHKRENTTVGGSAGAGARKFVAKGAATTATTKLGVRGASQKTNGQSLIKPEASDDLESIFEKMHSDKAGGSSGQQGNESASGIDMPALGQEEDEEDEDEEGGAAGQSTATGQPVSMPSLDDDMMAEEQQQQQEHGGEEEATTEEQHAANASAEGGVPMEIEDMHNSVEGGEQLKFIVNENGQLLQLDNHIITDAEGNQIIVQGADSEHLQQLLQSVAGLEGGTLQMIQGENNQMILVQQGDNEPQLIDASLLNADGQIVIQQAEGGGGAGGEGEIDSQSSEDHHHQGEVAGEQQQGEEYSDAHQEAVAVLAAVAEQHAAAAAASGEVGAGAVDESSQEAVEGEATTGEEVAAEGGASDENSQAASEAVTAGDEDYDQLIPPC